MVFVASIELVIRRLLLREHDECPVVGNLYISFAAFNGGGLCACVKGNTIAKVCVK